MVEYHTVTVSLVQSQLLTRKCACQTERQLSEEGMRNDILACAGPGERFKVHGTVSCWQLGARH
eukprot:4737036-Amphidinium_carterae.1